ncbi:hypothetical protein [Streptomyces antibioticus]|uniref:hypothetical protein n=1 Tax=Streptomyces antibioticus TaxID=1890 RepID=UPI00224C84EB|nr:hypothetical protein [Streptomyces antibioticus]MCX4743820.1 hypothetical protein [Streptomyces antibioticus]
MSDTPQSPRPADGTTRRGTPPAALIGFLLLLVLVFAVSYAVGSAVGPVAPGMHDGGGDTGTGGGDTSGTGGGMEDMPGMEHGGGE